MKEWDTWGLFQMLLDDFLRLLQQAESLHSDNTEDTLAVRTAIVGFQRFRPLEEWGYEQFQIIRGRLDGDLSSLEWFEDGAEAIRLFSCLCLGAMLGKYAHGEIDDAGFLLGDAHLAGFNVTQDEAICRQWHVFRSAANPLSGLSAGEP